MSYLPGATHTSTAVYNLDVSAGGITKWTDIVWTIGIKSSKGSGMFVQLAPKIRCDSEPGLRNKSGCVFRDTRPVWSVRNNADFAAHVRRAQQTNLPGAKGGTPLTRITSESDIAANRRGSCGHVTGPRPTGMDCDEYPFASTDQGGRNGGQGRTFANCAVPQHNGINQMTPGDMSTVGGYSVCLIDSGQNRSAGGQLSWFYAKNRIRAYDPFYVYAGNP